MPLATASVGPSCALKRGIHVPPPPCPGDGKAPRHGSSARSTSRGSPRSADSSSSSSRSRRRAPSKGRGRGRGHRNAEGGRGRGRDARRRSGSRSRSHPPRASASRWFSQHAAPARPGRPCRYGRRCSRRDCWFLHPDGRAVDDRRPAEARRAAEERRAPSPRRSRSSSPLRRRRRARRSRSSSTSSRRSSRRASPRRASPRRSSSPASPPPSPAAPAPQKAGEPEDPESFKAFVRREVSDDTAPEEAVAKFHEFRQRLEGARVEAFRDSGLFYDLYNPKAALRRHELRLAIVRQAAEAFRADLARNTFGGCRLRASGGERRCPVRPEFFAEDPDTNSLHVRALPPAANALDVCDFLRGRPSLLDLSWARASGFLREIRARFGLSGEARAALNALADAAVLPGAGGAGGPRPSLVDPSARTCEASVLPSEMSCAARIEKDVALSARLVRKLDGLFGVPPEATEAFLRLPTPDEVKLDQQVIYLRRVHSLCFYSGVWCQDAWALRERCGVHCVVRAERASMDEGSYAKEHEERLESLLASAKLEAPEVGAVNDEVALRTNDFLCEKAREINPSRAECLICKKHFKNLGYVHKHLRKAHSDEIVALEREAFQKAACAAFAADPSPPSLKGFPLPAS